MGECISKMQLGIKFNLHTYFEDDHLVGVYPLLLHPLRLCIILGESSLARVSYRYIFLDRRIAGTYGNVKCTDSNK